MVCHVAKRPAAFALHLEVLMWGLTLAATEPVMWPIQTSWPPPIAPVWPTIFSAYVHGAEPSANITSETGKWYYEWPTNRYRADYLNKFSDGTVRNDTQFWNASKETFYFFEDNFASCGYFKIPISILRPDWAEASEATWLNRSTVDGVDDVDTYFADGGPGNQFYLAMNPRSNLPVAMWGTDGGGNHFDSIMVGGDWHQPDWDGPDPFESLDVSNCISSDISEWQKGATRQQMFFLKVVNGLYDSRWSGKLA